MNARNTTFPFRDFRTARLREAVMPVREATMQDTDVLPFPFGITRKSASESWEIDVSILWLVESLELEETVVCEIGDTGVESANFARL